MFKDNGALKKYVAETFLEVTDSRFDDDHWDLECSHCGVTRGFQLTKRQVGVAAASAYNSLSVDLYSPYTYILRCPVCHRFKQWIVYELYLRNAEGKEEKRYFRVASIPSEGLEDIAELPEEPTSLRAAYKQAIRCMDANANIAAAAMFRRALQIITRDLLGAKPGNLANELTEVVGKPYNGSSVTTNFSDIGYVLKEAGNQAAHPDKHGDPDLMDFTSQDATDLQQIFMELVSELFIIPAAAKRAKQEFLARRKITLPSDKNTTK